MHFEQISRCIQSLLVIPYANNTCSMASISQSYSQSTIPYEIKFRIMMILFDRIKQATQIPTAASTQDTENQWLSV